MCFPNKQHIEETKIKPFYQNDGTLNTDTSLTPVVIPEGLNEHIDSVFENFDLEDGILDFVYENGVEVTIVYTSPQAQEYCVFEEESVDENPFEENQSEEISFSQEDNQFEENYCENINLEKDLFGENYSDYNCYWDYNCNFEEDPLQEEDYFDDNQSEESFSDNSE